jgi:hypothetical protein
MVWLYQLIMLGNIIHIVKINIADFILLIRRRQRPVCFLGFELKNGFLEGGFTIDYRIGEVNYIIGL